MKLLVLLLCVSSTWADQWPQFRGPQGNQLSPIKRLPQVWDPDENIKWQVKIPGRAWSSPVVWGDKIFVTSAVDEVSESSSRPAKSGSRIKPTNDHRWEIYCLDKESGIISWKRVATQGKPTMTTHGENTFASETPVTDGKRVYAYFGMKGLYCYDFQGKLLWEKDLGVYDMARDWGTGSSPVMHGGLLYLQIDNEEQSFLVALDGKTGQERWRVSRQEGSNWSTPVIWQNRRRTELVTGGKTVHAYDPLSGDLLWKLHVGGGRSSASPTADRDCLFFGTEKRSDGGGFLFAVKPGASGDITPKPGESTSAGVLWSQAKAGVAFASPLVYRNLVYILERHRGGIKCFHAQTGELIYGERLPGVRTFWATPWAYQDKIFCLDDRGTTHVVQAGPEFKILGQNKLSDGFYASCALTENAIVMRGVASLYCISETDSAEPGQRAALVEYDAKIPQLAFAAQELKAAAREAEQEDLRVLLIVKPDESSPEAFRICVVGSKQIEVTGSDATGAMYGGLEVADLLRLGLPIKDQERKPFVEKRGVKINIPLDIRTPAFDDSGEAAQKNIQTMWDFEFWKAYLDDLARYRYNLVSLWAAHPFPTMIKLEAYPEIAVDDVYYSKAALNTTHLDAAVRLGDDKEGSLSLGKKISIDEKIKYWQRVFQYAEDRGIEIMMVHWNVHMHGADGKYGITNAQDNPATIKYIRACVREMLLTYPQITGIGVCAGENDDRYLRDEYMTEHFVFNAYGRAVMDVKKLQPDREIRFIIRRHSTEYDDFTHAFKDYTGGIVETSVKYAVAHMYSSRRPQEWEKRIVDEGWLEKYKVWLNLRNDDIFMHRWGSPDYARAFIKWIPHEHVSGFYMGSDTYVWGREFISKNPETAGRLEIDKHWYRDRLWGQLAYNNKLGDDYWQAVLAHRFPGVDARLLLEAWESVSEVIPQLNRSVWSPTDGSFAAEGCRRTSGFLTLNGYHFDRPAMVLNRIENAPDPQCTSVTDWARAHLKGQALPGVTPLQVSENLDGYAKLALAALPALRRQMGDNVELKETLNDIESMAYLGRYYADKMRAAAKLALYREGGRKDETYLDQAVAHLEDAVEEWKAYAAVLTPQYKTQIGARANTLNWNATLKEVEKEVETIKEEGDYPELRFVNLTDGAHIAEGSDLRVEVEATDRNGVPKVKLRLNGLVLNANRKTGDRFVWSGSSEDILKSLDSGMYHLEAVAVDKNGLRTSREINLSVGNASQSRLGDWKDKIHQVILHEGETLSNGDTRNFPRLECFLSLADDGALALNSGTPGNSEGRIWGTNGKANRPKPHPVPFRFYIALDGGQLQIHREKPGRPKVIMYETRSVSGPGPFKLGITASRRLIVYREKEGRRRTVWMTPMPD